MKRNLDQKGNVTFAVTGSQAITYYEAAPKTYRGIWTTALTN